MAEEPIPFAEGAPPDNLQVESIGENVLIGDPDLDNVKENDSNFDANLAEDMSEKELRRSASDLIDFYNTDKEARSEWEERYKKGLQTLEPEGGIEESDEERAVRGLSTVVHPMIAEAATQFNARAIAELYPSGGPVKTVIVGEPNEETEEQSRRVREYMNYQISQEMPEYFPDLDQMLFHLPLVGQTFKKVWWDSNLDRQCSQFVKAEDFIRMLFVCLKMIIIAMLNLAGIYQLQIKVAILTHLVILLAILRVSINMLIIQKMRLLLFLKCMSMIPLRMKMQTLPFLM